MDIITILLIAVALSMDAFAVALSTGMTHKDVAVKEPLIMAGFFGVFQAIMPFIGWAFSSRFSHYFKYNYIIAFVLLAFIGGKMIHESFSNEETKKNNFKLKTLLILSIATSIDAMAVGVSFALSFKMTDLENNISFLLIGIITFIISFAGFYIGKRFGTLFRKKAELFGGLVLIAIGIKILIENLIK